MPEDQAEDNHSLLKRREGYCFNALTLTSWFLFMLYMFAQPWLSLWANNLWAEWNVVRTSYDIVGDDFQAHKYKTRFGLCTTPLRDMYCTDGQNFTELVMIYRPDHPFGCGCGEGILGETLCPRTSYGHTLSDYVSTAPGLGAMLGLSLYPIMGARALMQNMRTRHHNKPFAGMLLCGSLNSFQINYIAWGVASVCVFPKSHAILTVTFLGSYAVFGITLLCLYMCEEYCLTEPTKKKLSDKKCEAKIMIIGISLAIIAIVAGAIPRIFFMIDVALDKPVMPDWNYGPLSYSFWLGEVVGLSILFGLYPLVFLTGLAGGDATWGGGLLTDEPPNYTPLT